MNVSGLNENQLTRYLSKLQNRPVTIRRINQLGGSGCGADALKGFGYGIPIRVIFADDSGEHDVVVRQVQRNGFGREHESDRIAEVWRDYHSFNALPQHVAARDIAGVQADGQLASLGNVVDLWLVTDYAPGQPYAEDLLRLCRGSRPRAQDRIRAEMLASYLADIHQTKHDDSLLWRRRLRDLVGHGEGIMGLTDSYAMAMRNSRAALYEFVSREELIAIETAANRWRWRLKAFAGRLSQVHGDFHPFNILFTDNDVFTVIDRSRGVWGEPADDVSCLTINYLFFSLQRSGKLSGIFDDLYHRFWQTYLTQTEDEAMLAVIAPWYAWRALVLASPQWYPTIAEKTRRQLLNFARNVMAAPLFDWQNTNGYLVQP